MPLEVNDTRLYLTNGQKFILNNLTGETASVSNKYIQYSQSPSTSNHFDGMTDAVGTMYAYVQKGQTVNESNTLSLNITKYDTSGYEIDLSTLHVAIGTGSVGNLRVIYKDEYATLNTSTTFTNAYEELTTGTITLDPLTDNVSYNFYGKVVVQYRLTDGEIHSDLVTSTVYFLPYPTIRVVTILNRNINIDSGHYKNDLSGDDFILKSNGVNQTISVKLSNSNTATDSITAFTSEVTNIKNYIINNITGNISLDNSVFNSVTLNDVVVTNTYFTTLNTKIFLGWGSSDTFDITFNSTTEGDYVGYLQLLTNYKIKYGTSMTMTPLSIVYIDLSLTAMDQLLKGDVSFASKPESGQNDFIVDDVVVGHITCFKMSQLAVMCIVSVTTGSDVHVDLSDETYFKHSVNVVVENKTTSTINVVTHSDGFVDPGDSKIYVGDNSSGTDIATNRKRIFTRILFDPMAWEPSPEYIMTEEV